MELESRERTGSAAATKRGLRIDRVSRLLFIGSRGLEQPVPSGSDASEEIAKLNHFRLDQLTGDVAAGNARPGFGGESMKFWTRGLSEGFFSCKTVAITLNCAQLSSPPWRGPFADHRLQPGSQSAGGRPSNSADRIARGKRSNSANKSNPGGVAAGKLTTGTNGF